MDEGADEVSIFSSADEAAADSFVSFLDFLADEDEVRSLLLLLLLRFSRFLSSLLRLCDLLLLLFLCREVDLLSLDLDRLLDELTFL